jgi:heme exporter protein A
MNQFSGTDLACMRGGRLVFSGLDFVVGPGRALLLVGPNGSGKSSLLRLMAGLARPDAGAIAWDGAAIAHDPQAHAARLHYVGHLDAVKPSLTVAENLVDWVKLRGGAPVGVADGLARFGLRPLAEMPARLLSAGQRRRLALARIAASPAELWLLDEPTVALDRASVAALEAAVADHLGAGRIVVLSSNVDIGIPDPLVLRIDDFTALDDLALDGVA